METECDALLLLTYAFVKKLGSPPTEGAIGTWCSVDWAVDKAETLVF